MKALCSDRRAPLKTEPTPLEVVARGALCIEEEARVGKGVATASVAQGCPPPKPASMEQEAREEEEE